MANKGSLSILVVDDDESIRLYLKTLFQKNWEVFLAANEREAVNTLANHAIDIIFLDIMLDQGEDGLILLKKFRSRNEDVDVVILSGVKDVKTVVHAIKEGATDYITKPIEKTELHLTLDRVLNKRELRTRNITLKQQLTENNTNHHVIGSSPHIRETKSMISKLRGQNVNVFLVGETGTGKEVFARLLHQQEKNPDRPFISLNCAAIPENLLESTFFGHEKGAFTGATERKLGKFELANGGDLFLDEVSCLTPELQAKLLRVLEEKEVERVGGTKVKKVSFRVISASNENILKKVTEGSFRSDLFYRLNTVTIQIPSLNDRREDIVPLAEYFLEKYRRTPKPKSLSLEVKDLLINHDWRGNVRELRNTIENMVIFSKGDEIQISDTHFFQDNSTSSRGTEANSSSKMISSPFNEERKELAFSGTYGEAIQRFERELLLSHLKKNRWSKTKTCREMGISRNKLYRKLRQLNIDI